MGSAFYTPSPKAKAKITFHPSYQSLVYFMPLFLPLFLTFRGKPRT